ncbi:hypothetical protein JOL62DRAFT_25617 [Phyllosticta paracitricarpa]|uniref:Uncharacterized protein n=1 Tax=Phyllosticta paracitricarpa TaxID=2016321 RepID=A0ABR1NB80_9PEZI
MPLPFVSIHGLDDPFVDPPCTLSPEALHRQALKQPSIQRALSALKTSFTEEDIEQIAATHRHRRRQLTGFIKNRTLLRQLDQVLDDNFDNALDAADREYLMKEGPWEIIEIANGEQALRGRRDEFQDVMVELDDDTVAVGLPCQKTTQSAHASLKTIHIRMQEHDESVELDKTTTQAFESHLEVSKRCLERCMQMMRDTLARFRGVLDDAGNEELPVCQNHPVPQSIHKFCIDLLMCLPIDREMAWLAYKLTKLPAGSILSTAPSPQPQPSPPRPRPLRSKRPTWPTLEVPRPARCGWNWKPLIRATHTARSRTSHPTSSKTWAPKPTLKGPSRRHHRSSFLQRQSLTRTSKTTLTMRTWSL